MRVPRYGGQQVRATPLPEVRRTPQQEGAGVGEAVSGFGNVAANIGIDLLDRHLTERRDREDRVALTGAERSLGELEAQVTTSPDKGYLSTVSGKDVLDEQRYADTLESFDIQAGEIASSLKPGYQRDVFEAARDRRRQYVTDKFADHRMREFDAYEKGEAVAGIETAVNLGIANADNPERLNEELHRIVSIVDSSGKALGLKGPEAKAAFLQKARGEVYERAIDSLIVDGKHDAARAYFEEASEAGQLPGDRIARIKEKLESGTTDKAGIDAVADAWNRLGPTDDKDPIKVEEIEADLRERFKDDTKKYDAAMQYHRARLATVEAGRRQREDAIVSDIYDRVAARQSLEQITQSESWLKANGRVKQAVRDMFSRDQEHAANLAYQAEARAAAREGRAAAAESRAEARANRAEREVTRAGQAHLFEATDPEALKGMTRGQALMEAGKLPTPELQDQYRDRWEKAQRDPGKASLDRTIFNDVAGEMLGEWAFPNVKRDDTQSAQLGRALSAAELAIARASAGGKTVGVEQQRDIIKDVLSAKVRIESWGRDPEQVGAVVNAGDRTKAYVYLKDIDANPQLYGKAYQQALAGLRRLVPDAAKMTDTQLRSAYGPQIQRAIGRAFSQGVTRAEIDAALKGQ